MVHYSGIVLVELFSLLLTVYTKRAITKWTTGGVRLNPLLSDARLPSHL